MFPHINSGVRRPGEEGGAAVAETLSGKNNPAGRLPVTFYTGDSQLPNFEDYSMERRATRRIRDQRSIKRWLGFVVSHPFRDNTAERMGRPGFLAADERAG